MAVARLKWFTKLHVLKQMGRELLERFFARFDWTGKAGLPPASASDDEYFQAVARILMAPEELPEELCEALYLVDEMAHKEGHERLLTAARKAGLEVDRDGTHTQPELALEVFLAKPKLLEAAHREQRLVRMTSFEYFGSKTPSDRRATFTPPTAEQLDAVGKDLDEWFAAHSRGKGTVRLGMHLIDGEYFFIIRHGDTLSRTPTVNEQKTEVLRFRPEIDGVAVYSPEFDEIRIRRTGTKGERELYRKRFGLLLFGEENWFSRRQAYGLESLRKDGPDALDVSGCGDLERAVLREYEVALDNGFDEVVVRKATDIFAAAEEKPVKRDAIPKAGRLVRAVFDLYFAGKKQPRRVEIRTPNTLKLGRHCDVRLVQRWLGKQGFRVAADASDGAEASGVKKGWTLVIGGHVISERGRAAA
jgi:hypothetical protein